MRDPGVAQHQQTGGRCKLRVELPSGVHNDTVAGGSQAWADLLGRIARRVGTGDGAPEGQFQVLVSTQGRTLAVQGEEGWKVIQRLYEDGCTRSQQNGCATFRVKLIVRLAPTAGSNGLLQEQEQASRPPTRRARPTTQQQQQDGPKRICQRKSKSDLASTVAASKQDEAAPSSHHSNRHQSPAAVVTVGSTAWDEQVLQSIKRTVTKLHFGSRLAPQPPPA